MIFICPVCGKPLFENDRMFKCENLHNFDIARSGYVNLLLGSSGGNHGDNRLMARARRDFLSKGFYRPLADAVCREASRFSSAGAVLLDCGCGEGYYTSAIGNAVPKCEVNGFDISKDELSIAAKRGDGISYAVASSFSIPAADASADMIFEIFSPYCGAEFLRVLKKGGVMIMAYPLENHLWELKKAVYDEPYKNEVSDSLPEGFELLSVSEVKNKLSLSQPDIMNLFMMTPYYYKSGACEQARAAALDSLEVSAEFVIAVYRKI